MKNTTLIASLADTAVPLLTLRAVMERSFNDNWDNRRVVAQATDSDTVFQASMTFYFDVPMAMAKQVLIEMGLG